MLYLRSFYKFLVGFSVVFLLLLPLSGSAQNDAQHGKMKQKIAAMQKILQSDPDKGYAQLNILLEEAKATNKKETELVLLANSCWYFLMKADFDKVNRVTYTLEEKASEYKNINYQAVAHIYRCQVYIENNLKDKAINEYTQALEILEKGDAKDHRIIGSKANAHTYIANLYYNDEQYAEGIAKLSLAREQILQQQDEKKRVSSLYRNYSNTGTVYEKLNSDSAEYYVQKSISIAPIDKGQKDFIMFLNYSVLGDVYLKKKNYSKALGFYNEAETVLPPGSDLKNQESLYAALVKTHTALGDSIAAKDYRSKVNEVKLQIADSKYKSLHSVVKESGREASRNKLLFAGIISVAVLLCGTLLFLYIKKSRLLQKLENQSTHYLNEPNTDAENREAVSQKLVTLCSGNDPGFITEFNDAFPHFKEKLSAINDSIVDSEIEFCAYLKLNLTTKDIARIKNLEPKTVQNRKYRIRKKLDIPNDTDIYFYFNLF